jgi:murein DD-endopeptidase MepM/ murein hydrolase activator NlpD
MRPSPLFPAIALAVLAALAPLAGATTIFKYTDADGVTHYTDQNPGGKHNAEVLELWGSSSAGGGMPEQQRVVFIEKRGTPQQPELYLVNQNQAPVEISFKLTQQDNVRTPAIPEQWIVAGNSQTKIATLQPQHAGQPLRYDYQLRWQLGDPRSHPNERFAYTPPIPAQTAFKITQGFNGSYSHHTGSSRYAIDIGMPIGTGIRAARGGEVVKVQDVHGEGGNSTAYRSQTNSVYVLHDDGTFGVYAHLRKGSALVKPGQHVRAGQLIAQSGNSGYSTAPHLHFAVLRNAGLKWESVPFLLSSNYGAVKPVKGMAVTGMPLEQVASRDH